MAKVPNIPMAANRKMSTNPIGAPRTNRMHTARGITSLPAGKVVPLVAIPLFREDSVRSGRLRINFESMETAEMLLNGINVKVSAWVCPKTAFDRFEGSMDQFNRSYAGEQFKNLPVVPFFETMKFTRANEILKYLGSHAKLDAEINTDYIEAYNQIWNFRAKNKSKDLELRDRLDTSLAPAFWMHERFAHIVPDFDQAVIDGEVALNVANAKLPVKGLGIKASEGFVANGGNYREAGGATRAYPSSRGLDVFTVKGTANGTGGFPDVYAELLDNGITLSLSNIDLARKTQAFAKLREKYHGHDDDWIIDMLMNGYSIPEQAFMQPMLIGERTTVFGQAKRYASDAANLTESVVNGATFVDISIALPRLPMGGIVMVFAEIMPDQLFERQKDHYLHAKEVKELPEYLRDTLDPEKVDVVYNDHVDVDHDQATTVFGYEPMNAKWNVEAPHIGGKFYRPEVDAGFDEDRQRIWAVETKNPKLARDFYLCTNIHTKPFVVTNQDPFEATIEGDVLINGLTVFGGLLAEATNDYDKVMEKAPTDRIQKP